MKYLEIDSFYKINNRTSPFLIDEGDVYDCQNVDLSRKIGAAKKAGDYEMVGAQMVSSKDIIGLDEFERDAEANELYAYVDGASSAEIYKWGGTSWASQSQSLTKSTTGRFASIPELDTLFFVNYSDATRSYNGSSWSTSTHVTSAPKAKHVETQEARLFLGNVVVSSTAYPARYYFSSSALDGNLTWDTTNDYDILPGPITGMVRNGENLLMFTKNSIYRADAYERIEVSRVGTEASDTIRTRDRWTLFANEKGAYATDGASMNKISGPVQEYWEGITQSFVDNMSAAILGDKYYLFIGDVTSPDTFSNILLAYDIEQNKWEIYSTGENITKMASHTNSSQVTNIYFGNDDGEVWKFLSGTGQNSLDFTSYVETHYIYPDNQINEYLEIEVWGKDMSGVKVYYKHDDDGRWEPAGELKEDYSVAKFRTKGEKIKFKFMETGRGTNWELYKFRLGYRNMYGTTE